MTAQEYWKVIIQHDDDGYGYTDSGENSACSVSWLGLVMVHVNSKKIKGFYLLITAETLFSLSFLSRITFLYGFLLLTLRQWIRINHFSYNFKSTYIDLSVSDSISPPSSTVFEAKFSLSESSVGPCISESERVARIF